MYLDRSRILDIFEYQGANVALTLMTVVVARECKKLISEVLFNQRALAQLEKYTLHFLLSWHLWW